jgi:hypothetical protein
MEAQSLIQEGTQNDCVSFWSLWGWINWCYNCRYGRVGCGQRETITRRCLKHDLENYWEQILEYDITLLKHVRTLAMLIQREVFVFHFGHLTLHYIFTSFVFLYWFNWFVLSLSHVLWWHENCWVIKEVWSRNLLIWWCFSYLLCWFFAKHDKVLLHLRIRIAQEIISDERLWIGFTFLFSIYGSCPGTFMRSMWQYPCQGNSLSGQLLIPLKLISRWHIAEQFPISFNESPGGLRLNFNRMSNSVSSLSAMTQIPFGIVIDALSHQNQNVVRMSEIIHIYPIDGW